MGGIRALWMILFLSGEAYSIPASTPRFQSGISVSTDQPREVAPGGYGTPFVGTKVTGSRPFQPTRNVPGVSPGPNGGYGTPFVGTKVTGSRPFQPTRNVPGVSPGPNGSGQGLCDFPVSWQQGRRWWRGYLTSARGSDESNYRNYQYDIFNKNKIFSYEQLHPTQIKRQSNCLAATTFGDSTMYLTETSDMQTGVKWLECRQYAQANAILLLRVMIPGSGSPRGQAGLQNCMDIIDAKGSYEVLPGFDPETGEIEFKECPFREAIYQAVVHEQTPTGLAEHCKNVPDSKVKIKKGVIDISSCRKQNTYETPFFSQLYCMEHWEGNAISNQFGSKAANDKSILLMYDTSKNGDRVHFYIAKYRVETNDLLKLNLHVGNRNFIQGKLIATADTSGESYKQFVLKWKEDMADLGPTAISPTKVTDECGGCLAGICQLNSGSYQCVCKPGFGGQYCNQGLPSGYCTDSHCQNGAECEQHGEYYYCRCSNIYTGFDCEVPKYCTPNPCKHGECQTSLGGFHCLCPEGYTGRTCASHIVLEAEEDRRILIILSSILSVLGLAIVIVTITICQCKRKKSDKKLPKNPDGDLPNQTYSSMTSWFPDYKRELAAQEVISGPE